MCQKRMSIGSKLPASIIVFDCAESTCWTSTAQASHAAVAAMVKATLHPRAIDISLLALPQADVVCAWLNY